jgi:hypothetical protein
MIVSQAVLASIAFAALLTGLDDAPAAKNPPFAPQQLVEDFHVLRTALEEGHPGVYRFTPKEELNRIFDQAEKSLDRPMDAVAFYRVVAPVVTALKCGHTGVRLPASVRVGPTSSKPVLPLDVRILDGKAYVFRDLSTEQGTFVGKEIRSINGVPVATIVATMVKAMPGDGDVTTSRIHRLRHFMFSYQLVNLLGLNAPYHVAFWDAGHQRETVEKIEGIEATKLTNAAKARFPQDQRANTAGTFRFVEGNHIGVMKINGFGGFVDQAHKKTLKDLYKESFTAMQEKGAKVLIIDLRDNGGGADELGKLLLSYLVDQPFQYYDDLVINALQFSFAKYSGNAKPVPEKMVERQPNGKYRLVKHPNWGTQQPSMPTFTGKVYILINGGSFSTTSEFLSHAHYRKRATFIGEESGGGYTGNTSGPSVLVKLPNTKLELGLPLMGYYMAVTGSPANHGVVPDYPVTYTIQELLEGKDKEMALALELAGKG